eukprot:m.195733 g.195733  ORF g.195733 m.195733 type:complete len:339 (+) comp10080_c0_seq12:169-1185(+)
MGNAVDSTGGQALAETLETNTSLTTKGAHKRPANMDETQPSKLTRGLSLAPTVDAQMSATASWPDTRPPLPAPHPTQQPPPWDNFRSSRLNYAELCRSLSPASGIDGVYRALSALVFGYCRANDVDPSFAENFVAQLRSEASIHLGGSATELLLFQQLWTSGIQMPCAPHPRELSFILNEVVRRGDRDLLQPAVQLLRLADQLPVDTPAAPSRAYYRGGSISASKQQAFRPDLRYCVANPLSVSRDEAKAESFCTRAVARDGGGTLPILWRIFVPPDTARVAVLGHSALPDEQECLLSPYTFFVVRDVGKRGAVQLIDVETLAADVALQGDVIEAPWS